MFGPSVIGKNRKKIPRLLYIVWSVYISKCCSFLFVTCHVKLVFVTGSEMDVGVTRLVDGNDWV
jgi:hypothetical protein